jgi:hypothetical protein
VVSALGVFSMYALLTILKEDKINRTFIGLLGSVAFLSLLATRMVAIVFLAHYTQKGYDRHYVLVGGHPEDAVPLAEMLENIRGAVYQVRGLVTQDPGERGKTYGRWKVLGTYDEVPSLASLSPVDVFYLLPRGGRVEDYRELVEECEKIGMDIHLRLMPFERMLSKLSVHTVSGVPFLSFTTAPGRAVPLLMKRLLDVSGALALLVIFSPLYLIVSLLVKLTSRGAVIFQQERAGMNGRTFTLYKFRTMVEGAHQQRFALESKNGTETISTRRTLRNITHLP